MDTRTCAMRAFVPLNAPCTWFRAVCQRLQNLLLMTSPASQKKSVKAIGAQSSTSRDSTVRCWFVSNYRQLGANWQPRLRASVWRYCDHTRLCVCLPARQLTNAAQFL